MIKRVDRVSAKWDGVIHSTNPLRAGEPNVVFSAETTVWGMPPGATKPPDSPQKVWQHLAMSADRCQVMLEVLERSGDLNDFAKRTLASFIVVELHAAFAMVRRSRANKLAISGLRPTPVQEVEAEIDALFEKTSKFAILRDKLAAHLDGDVDVAIAREVWQYLTYPRVATWVTLLLRYINVLKALFPDEYQTHFGMRNIIMPTIAPGRTPPSLDDYMPFDSPNPTEPGAI
jgi:hypothetical protein